MRTKYARPSRRPKPYAGNKHSGVYGKEKEIIPAPQASYMRLTWNMPIEYAVALQELYPDKSLSMAVKSYILDTLKPQSLIS
jgi:hypothetical protein